MAVKQYSLSRQGNNYLSKNFQVREFACHDGSDTILIDDNLVDVLQRIRNHFGSAVSIHSAYRHPAYNRRVGGVSNSQHVYGTAADIHVEGVSHYALAQYATFLLSTGKPVNGGVGYYSWGVHVDTRGNFAWWNKYCGTGGNTDDGLREPDDSGGTTDPVGHKIYLSPSSQFENTYAYGNTNEAEQCQKIADKCGEILNSYGVPVMVGKNTSSISTRIAESNNFGATVHIPIHTNATSDPNDVPGGAMVMCTQANTSNPFVVNIYNNLCGLQDNTDYGIRVRTDLAEITRTNGTCVYCECEFHDNIYGAQFIVDNIDKIAWAIAGGVCSTIGVDISPPEIDSYTKEELYPDNLDLTTPAEEVDPTLDTEDEGDTLTLMRHRYAVIDGNVWQSVGTDGEDGAVTWSDLVDTGQPYSTIENLLAFNSVVNGKYHIKAQTQFEYGDLAIPCVDDMGNDYVAQTEDFTVTDKPGKWLWGDYLSVGDKYKELCSTSYVPISGKEFQPIKASVWCSFTNKINSLRVLKGLEPVVFSAVYGKSNYSTESCNFTPKIYNEVADAINELGGNVSKITPGTALSASLFEDLRDEFNNIVNTLD